MDKSFRSYAKYGTIVEIVGHEHSQTVVFNPYDRDDKLTKGGSTTVRAMGKHRFRIERVLHRALEGLILTCEVTVFHEEGSDLDVKLSQTPLFQQL